MLFLPGVSANSARTLRRLLPEHGPLTAPATFSSTDHRLSPFWSIFGGLTVAHDLTDGRPRVNIGATRQSRLDTIA